MHAPIRSILMLHSGALGDTVLHLRIAQSLRLALGEVAITWLGRDDWLAIVRACPFIDRLTGLEAMRAYRLFAEGDSTDADLADWLGQFDIILNGLVPEQSPATDRLARFARRALITYDTRPRADSQRHIVPQWIDSVAAALAPRWKDAAETLRAISGQMLLEPADLFGDSEHSHDVADGRRAVISQRANAPGPMLLHPGSGGRGKCWPLDRFMSLTRLLADRGRMPALILGPVETDLLADEIESLRQCCSLLANPLLPELMSNIRLASAYIGNDSGPTHLAAAMGTPTIAIFGPTNPNVWRPIGPEVIVMESTRHAEGWYDLTPEAVAKTAMTMR